MYITRERSIYMCTEREESDICTEREERVNRERKATPVWREGERVYIERGVNTPVQRERRESIERGIVQREGR
jgi:hypothetical protein